MEVHGRGYETYFSESMIPEINQVMGLMHVDSGLEKGDALLRHYVTCPVAHGEVGL